MFKGRENYSFEMDEKLHLSSLPVMHFPSHSQEPVCIFSPQCKCSHSEIVSTLPPLFKHQMTQRLNEFFSAKNNFGVGNGSLQCNQMNSFLYIVLYVEAQVHQKWKNLF